MSGALRYYGFSFAQKCLNRCNIVQPVACLYSDTRLGLDGFINTVSVTKNRFGSQGSIFRSRLQKVVAADDTMVYTDDLKNMIYLTENEQDCSLVLQMLRRYNSQDSLRFSNFKFGPVVMRMFHHLNKPKEALEAIQDKSLSGLFDHYIAYQITMNLLYKNNMYKEVLEVFEDLKSKQLFGVRFPQHTTLLGFAAAYKINTLESLEWVKNQLKQGRDVGTEFLQRTMYFAIGLALRQQHPQVAIELLSSLPKNFVASRNLSVWAFADKDNPKEALEVIGDFLQTDVPLNKSCLFYKEPLDALSSSVKKRNDPELDTALDNVMKSLNKIGAMNTGESIDMVLCKELMGERPRHTRDAASRPQARPRQRLYGAQS